MIQFGLMCNIVNDSIWRDLCALLQMIWFRLKCGIVGDCVWTYVQKHYPSDRCPFKKRKQLPKVFLFCKYTTNFGKSLVEGAAITKTRSTRYAFLQICCLFTILKITPGSLLLKNILFVTRCSWKSSEKLLRTFVLVSQIVAYFLTCEFVS